MARRSFKIYLVMESHYEADVPVQAYSRKQEAIRKADRHHEKMDKDVTYIRTHVKQIDLVTHDGARVLQALLAQKGN